jgi:3-oxo-5alpha-steroid 4-dehydrogenase
MSQTKYLSRVDDPLVINSGDDAVWADAADVVVVGLGGAGSVAALQARELGADVIAIDRFDGGGATAASGGVIYAGGTRYQREAGIEDSAANMFDYLSQEESAVREATLRQFCEGSSDDIDWLSAHGLQFGGKAYLEKTPYPPDEYYLYYSGNEKIPAYTRTAVPAARGHRTHGTFATGYAYYASLRQAVEAAGVRLRLHSPVRRLVLNSTARETSLVSKSSQSQRITRPGIRRSMTRSFRCDHFRAGQTRERSPRPESMSSASMSAS